MNKDAEKLINIAVEEMISKISDKEKIKFILEKHISKIHFVPLSYRVFGGLLQSLNIQYGNFIEVLMSVLIENEKGENNIARYKINKELSGKRSNKFEISKSVEQMIDEYISHCQTDYKINELKQNFNNLLESIANNKDRDVATFKHDIDLLFEDVNTGINYYVEIKYNDDHDTGKFVDINRKLIKTYAYLFNTLKLSNKNQLVPILFYFNNKKKKTNPYIPEPSNLKRGQTFFDDFLSISYDDIFDLLKRLGLSQDVNDKFDGLYQKVLSYVKEYDTSSVKIDDDN